MSRAAIVIKSAEDRERAARWAMHAPLGTRIEYKANKRSLEQNSKMWAALTEVSQQVIWYGIKLAPNDWKLIMLDALKREQRIVPNIDGSGFVNLGTSSSDLSRAEMSELLELILHFGAQRGVKFRDEPPPPIGETPSMADAEDVA